MKKIIFPLMFLLSCATNEHTNKHIIIIDTPKDITSPKKIYNEPIAISRMIVAHIDSADGVSVLVDFKNTSKKTFKYVIFGVVPYNRVGDPVSSEIGRKSYAILEITGPLEPDTVKNDCFFENVLYNNTVTEIKLKNVQIVYMDNSTVNLQGKKIADIYK